jgi:SAM-dependent methyltransferase
MSSFGSVLHTARRLLSRPKSESVFFEAEDIPRLLDIWERTGGAPGSDWEPYRHAHLRLPDWFQHGLDPWADAYRAQQHRLWQLITGIDRPYSPELHEREFGWQGVDPIRKPGFYHRRDAYAISGAADHFFATSMLLKHCGLKPGDRTLEYGAGFGHSALALARLGVNVDTVDISATFCEFVRQQAEFFQVPLVAHHGAFGFNPRPGELYDLIWFYESFHHCEDFMAVVPQLAQMLKPEGRLILAGEPVVRESYEAVPYPWGIRLHSEVVVVMRQTGWFELGFVENFLLEVFSRSAIFGNLLECGASSFGTLYRFARGS